MSKTDPQREELPDEEKQLFRLMVDNVGRRETH